MNPTKLENLADQSWFENDRTERRRMLCNLVKKTDNQLKRLHTTIMALTLLLIITLFLLEVFCKTNWGIVLWTSSFIRPII